MKGYLSKHRIYPELKKQPLPSYSLRVSFPLDPEYKDFISELEEGVFEYEKKRFGFIYNEEGLPENFYLSTLNFPFQRSR